MPVTRIHGPDLPLESLLRLVILLAALLPALSLVFQLDRILALLRALGLLPNR